MNQLSYLLITASLLLPAAAFATPEASALDGTWKQDMKTAKFAGKPYILSVQDGIFECNCVPPQKFAADGKPHTLEGNPYEDTATATVVSPTELDLVYAKAGKTVDTQAITVSTDGMTERFKGADSSATNSAPVDYDYFAKRTGNAPAGAHAISGTWIPISGSASDNALTATYKTDGSTLTMTTPTGQSYTVTIDGPPAAYAGDPGVTTVAVKKINDRTYQETDYRDGKVAVVTVMTVAADGKTAKFQSDFKFDDHQMEITANKQ
jgi:hypothetical protein